MNLNTAQSISDTRGKDRTEMLFKSLELVSDQASLSENKLTDDQKKEYIKLVNALKFGVAVAMPILCIAQKCNVITCPFHTNKNWPLGKPCPIESRLIVEWFDDYFKTYDLDMEDRAERTLVNSLVEYDILTYRINIMLSADPEASSLLKTDISQTGQTVNETTNIHPLLELRSKIDKDRNKTLQSLVKTPEAKVRKSAALKEKTTVINPMIAAKSLIKEAKTNLSFVSKDPVSDEMNIDAEFTEL
jgi:hypothetical protein